jgi:hypothetical protein
MSRFIDPTIPPRHLRNLEHRIAPFVSGHSRDDTWQHR